MQKTWFFRIYLYFKASHDFLSVIFGILGKFGIGIGHQKKTRKLFGWKFFRSTTFQKKVRNFRNLKIFRNFQKSKNFRNFQKSQNSKKFQNVKMLSFQKKIEIFEIFEILKILNFFSPRWKNIFHPNFFLTIWIMSLEFQKIIWSTLWWVQRKI